jgi:hypothetical protein
MISAKPDFNYFYMYKIHKNSEEEHTLAGKERRRHRNLQTPTVDQLRTAIEILTQLGERLHLETAHSIFQLPETQIGIRYAENIRTQAIEQTSQIKALAARLKCWHDELVERRKTCPPHPPRQPRNHPIIAEPV